MSEENASGIISHVNKNWIISVLLGIIVAILSIKIGTSDPIKDILNTGLALVSVVLAVVAIFQTIVSGYGLNQIKADINAKVSELREPAQKIVDAAAILGAQSEKIDSRAGAMQDIFTTLTQTVPTGPRQGDILKDIMTTTTGGWITLYICKKAIERDVHVNFKEIIGLPYDKYCNGYLSALIATKFVEGSYVKDTFDIANIGSITFDDKIEQAIRARLPGTMSKIDKFFDSDAGDE